MARFDRWDVYKIIISEGMIPLFYNSDKEEAKAIAEALYRGGSHILEFTNRGPAALDVFSYLVNIAPQTFPEMIIGAGTITDAQTAALFIAYGADFIVGPNFNEDLAKLCNKKRIPYIPGAATINEVVAAEEFGAEIIKIFPGSTVGGPKFVEALLGPLPRTKVMPTGGVSVDEENIKAWFKAGVMAVGMGSQLISKKLMQEKNYNAITELTVKALNIIKNTK
ncbi:MAG: bifunctional 4-hydroxy-2-oxoglutarate aldolase/2-dehydro-3-deoxy-phosphogluconate aldolase [Actinobacteria bacterium]|nr:bifunctional 4-hydroxy-2-oxoglutarate aldolase/2-dehydro-3-deoxy-phosphogluconate aldolase [Actinomycetota bacterium]